MLFTILLILCVVFLIIKYKISSNNYWKKRNVLQISDLNWTFLCDKRSMPEICKSIYDKYDSPYIGTFMGSTPALILKDIEDIKAVLEGDFLSFYWRGIRTNPKDILANNILFIDDYKKWKVIRHRMSPIFRGSDLKEMFVSIEKCARDFVELIEDNRYLRENPFSVLYTYTTASIGAAIFGVDTKSKNSTMYSPFLDMAWKSVKPSLRTNIKMYIANAYPSLIEFFNIKVFAEYEEFFLGIVKQVLAYRRMFIRTRHDFMGRCVELQRHGIMQDFNTGCELAPTDELWAAQAFALFIAGADTTANTLHFTLLEVAHNPHILVKLHEEIDRIFGAYKEEITYQDIKKLTYLDMVINEAMRKYPPIGFIQRICTKDTVLPSKLPIEKDTIIAIPVFAIHRDEKYYPNPEVFDPERFAPANVSNVNQFAYLAFGEGSRICLGKKFARFQLKTALAWLLRRFTLAEKSYSPKFEKSPFTLRDPEARYILITRDDLAYE